MTNNSINTNNQFGNNLIANSLHIYNTPPRRHLDNTMKLQLNGLTKDKKILIKAVLNNEEAYAFAEETRVYLKNQGFHVDNEVTQSLFIPPAVGESINIMENLIEIIIGHNTHNTY